MYLVDMFPHGVWGFGVSQRGGVKGLVGRGCGLGISSRIASFGWGRVKYEPNGLGDGSV